MNAFAALETPAQDVRKPVLDPRIYVEPRDKGDATEDARQSKFVNTMRRDHKAVKVYAVPNGAKRSQWERNKAMREGLALGWPDVGARWRGGHADIEFKNGTEMPRADQIETLNWLVENGHHVAVCRTAAGAMRWLASLGAPIKWRPGE
jgi:hypothetical protein